MSHFKWICHSKFGIELVMIAVTAMGSALPVSCGVQSPSSVDELKYKEDREVFYYFSYAQIEGMEQCTSLGRPLWTMSIKVVGGFLFCQAVRASITYTSHTIYEIDAVYDDHLLKIITLLHII